MNRFYNRAIEALRSDSKAEIADDISSYVRMLEHERVILINELSKSESIDAVQLINRVRG